MNLFLLMMQGSVDWPSTAGMLGVIVMGSGVIGGLIGALVCRPMIQEAMKALVSREIFYVYVDADKKEHLEMKEQLNAISERINDRGHRNHELRLPERFD